MKVLYCHTSASGGAELAAPALAEQLGMEVWIRGKGPIAEAAAARGLNVRLLTPKTDRRARSLRAYFAALLELVCVQVEMYKEFKMSKPTIVVSNTIQGLLHTSLPALLSRTPLIGYVRDLGRGGNRPGLETCVYWLLIHLFCRGVIFNSTVTTKSWCFFGRSIIVYTAVADDFFDTWGGNDSGPVIMLGRVTKWKGQVEAVRALELVNKSTPTRLDLVGASFFDDELALPEGALEIELSSHVPDPWTKMRDASLLIHASITPEPFGQVLAQAAAAGIPIVCSNRGGHLDWLADGETCLAADPTDTRAFAEAIALALSDRESARSRARKARVLAEAFREERAYTTLPGWLASIVDHK